LLAAVDLQAQAGTALLKFPLLAFYTSVIILQLSAAVLLTAEVRLQYLQMTNAGSAARYNTRNKFLEPCAVSVWRMLDCGRASLTKVNHDD